MAVGRLLRGEPRAHHAAGAGAVLHDHRLAERGLRVRRHGAREDVRAAAGREGVDEAHELRRRPLLRGDRHRAERERGRGEQSTASDHPTSPRRSAGDADSGAAPQGVVMKPG